MISRDIPFARPRQTPHINITNMATSNQLIGIGFVAAGDAAASAIMEARLSHFRRIASQIFKADWPKARIVCLPPPDCAGQVPALLDNAAARAPGREIVARKYSPAPNAPALRSA